MTRVTLTDSMSGMKTVTVREAQRHFKALLEAVKQGQEVEVTCRGVVVARIGPPSTKKVEWPDTMARLRELFPEGPLSGEPASRAVVELREGQGESAG